MELNKAQITGIVTLIAILSGAVVVTNIKQTYYCQNEDSVRECARISSTFKTCYWLDSDLNETRDVCTNGVWEPITKYVKFPVTPERNKLQNISITRPIIMTNAEIYKDLGNIQYIEGHCVSTISS